MTYDPARQRRVAFIRGRGKRDLDDVLLPIAETVDSVTPCGLEAYRSQMKIALDELLPGASRSPKTLDNWTTEIVHKLFGLVTFDGDQVRASARTSRLVDTKDQIGFFRELIYRFQFPFFGGAPYSWDEQNDLNLRPGVFCIQLVAEAQRRATVLTTDEIKYYALNSEDVQTGSVQPHAVLERILFERRTSRSSGFPVPAGSHATQHLNEFIGFLELAAMVAVEYTNRSTGFVHLLSAAPKALDVFMREDPTLVPFSRSPGEDASATTLRWAEFWTSIPPDVENAFYSDGAESSAVVSEERETNSVYWSDFAPPSGASSVDIGRTGERLVLDFESKRLGEVHPTLRRHLKNRSAERNIGYDIQSVRASFADDPAHQEQYIYIEVKTRRRATLANSLPRERLSMTSNEWNQAQSVQDAYFIYHVFLTSEGNQLFITQNPDREAREGRLRVVPSEYSVYLGAPHAERFDLDE